MLLTDRVQLGRFIGPDKTVSYDADRKPIAIKSLNQELYSDFETLHRERVATDAMIEESTEKIGTEWLTSTMRYHSMSDGGDWDVPLWVAVTHFFNHQTHHRGQVTALLKQFGLDPGATDFDAAIPLSGSCALSADIQRHLFGKDSQRRCRCDIIFLCHESRRTEKNLSASAMIFLTRLLKISLMIFFGSIERLRGRDFCHYRVAKLP